MKNFWTLIVGLASMLTIIDAARHRSLIKTCPEGYELVENPVSGKAECTCLPYHLYWPGDGLCYKELTQGPCKPGHKLIWNAEIESAECQCPPFWTRMTPDGECYEEYTQGLTASRKSFWLASILPNWTRNFFFLSKGHYSVVCYFLCDYYRSVPKG